MENSTFFEAVAQLLPLMIITRLVERATFGNRGHYDDPGDDKDSATRYLEPLPEAVTRVTNLLLILLVVLGETITLRVLYTGRVTPGEKTVVIMAVFLAGLSLVIPLALRSMSDISDLLPRKHRNIALVAGMTVLGIGSWALLFYAISPVK
jgi:hypothetical protein